MPRISTTKAAVGPRPQLDVRDLELVLALAETGSTTRAASTLHVTQSAVSRGLLLAEEKLGVRLFDRGARGIAPTEAGKRLVSGAGPLLAQLVELEARTMTPEPAIARIRVVCECYTAYRWLPSTLRSLARSGGLDVVLAPEHSDEPVQALHDGEVDIALLTTSPVSGQLLEEPLFSDEIVFVMAATHPLARRPSLTRRDLEEHTLITSAGTPEPERRWFFTKVFGRTKPKKVDLLRFPLTEAIMDTARAGMGIAIVSEWIASSYLTTGELITKRLASGPLHRPWRIAYRREAKEGARRLGGALAGAPPRIYAVAP